VLREKKAETLAVMLVIKMTIDKTKATHHQAVAEVVVVSMLKVVIHTIMMSKYRGQNCVV